jgi:hypothetical protein
MSPAMVAAAAISGCVTDVRPLLRTEPTSAEPAAPQLDPTSATIR